LTADFLLLLLAIIAGATLQVGVGVGFSIIVAPIMMVMFGTATAVPVLLMLNTLVSAAAIDTQAWRAGRDLIKNAILGCLIGIALGLLVYPYLSERIVLTLTATLLLIGVITTVLPMKSNIPPIGYKAVSGLSGLATVWAATPGPLMMFGLLAIGQPAKQARRLVQPIALVAYGVAFALHGLTDWQIFITAPNLPQLALAALGGSILGRLIGPKLPASIITNAIRVISVAACAALFHRAYVTG
jgi:uncharacterized membrane protein YfcA